jgi:hypothetical protein
MFVTSFTVIDDLEKIEIKTKNLDKKTIEVSLRKSLNKVYDYDLFEKIFDRINIAVPTCNICKSYHVPHQFEIEILGNEIRIKDVILLKKYQYCYAKSNHCKTLSRGRKMNPNSAKFISMVLAVTEEEAKKYIRENNKSSFYRENFKSESDYKKSQKRDLEYFIKKYGKKEGTKRYEETIKKQNYKRSKEFYIESLGPDRGIEKYLKYNKARTTTFRGTSKWSINLIKKILNEIDLEKFDKILYGDQEFCFLTLENKKTYFFDLYLLKNGVSKVVEFNGASWHAPPNLTESQKISWRSARGNYTWHEMYNKDEAKYNTIKKHNIDVLVVWDFESEEEIIKKCLRFIND